MAARIRPLVAEEVEMIPMLSIRNLSASVAGKPILNGLSLELPAGEVHAIMGPNGAGKSTLSYVLTGREGYEVTGGEVRLNGENLLALSPSERAAKGVFLSFQYPMEIPGVPALTFLRTALNAQHKARGEPEIGAPEFLKLIRAKAGELKIDFDMLRRALNVGFSGGEKKRMEILQMAVLAPSLAILDETDSGLDIDALRIVAEGVNAMRTPDRSMLVITHYQRLLDHIRPDRVHVLAAGRIVASGGPELAHQLEREGYDKYAGVAA
jgi:Fe-S cluster assembly ATP-binding protein